MKYTAVIILLILCISSQGQVSIQSSFSGTYIGRNQSLTIHYALNKFELYGGIKYNINKGLQSTDGSFLNKSAHAVTSGEHLGGVLGLNYSFLQLKNMNFFCFFESRESYMHVQHEFESAVVVNSQNGGEELAFTKRIENIGPFWIIDNNIGVGYKVNVFDNLYLNSRIGTGILLYKSNDSNYSTLFNKLDWNFSYMLSFGVGYTFNKSSNK